MPQLSEEGTAFSEAVWETGAHGGSMGAIIYQGEAVRIAASRVNTRSGVICGDSDARRALKPHHFVHVRAVSGRFSAL